MPKRPANGIQFAAEVILFGAVGRACESEHFVFVPCQFSFECEVKDGWPLRDAAIKQAQAIRANCRRHIARRLLGRANALWARGRLQRLFEISAINIDAEDSVPLIDMGFAAWRLDSTALLPFVCVECEMQTRLEYPASLQAEVEPAALAFWRLLLSAPSDLSTYEDSVLWEDGGCGDRMVRVGFDGREFFLGYHRIVLPVLCPACGGSGEESFCPANDICLRCNGSGKLTFDSGLRYSDRKRQRLESAYWSRE